MLKQLLTNILLIALTQTAKRTAPCQGCKTTNSENWCLECHPQYTLIVEHGSCSPTVSNSILANGQTNINNGGYTLNKAISSYKSIIRTSLQRNEADKKSYIKIYNDNSKLDNNCARFEGQKCIQCAYRSIFYKGQCFKVNDYCLKWDKFQGYCTACYLGFQLINGQCLVNSQTGHKDSNNSYNTWMCSNINRKCTKCSFRFYEDSGTCRQVSNLCKNWNISTGICTECYVGYQISDGSCIILKHKLQVQFKSSVPIPGCFQQQNGIFIVCAFRYYLLIGKCLQVNGLCKSWNQSDGVCTDCYLGYQLSAGVFVVLKKQPSTQEKRQSLILGCSQQKDGICVNCVFRHYLSNGRCIKVNDLCKSWNQSNGVCTDCYDGYELQENIRCILKKKTNQLRKESSQQQLNHINKIQKIQEKQSTSYSPQVLMSTIVPITIAQTSNQQSTTSLSMLLSNADKSFAKWFKILGQNRSR